jgi:outer membrane biogenesis lipoprotein LolB
MYYKKFCRRINFTNSQQRKKLKIKKILIRNSAEIIKSKEGVTNEDDTEGLYSAFFTKNFHSCVGFIFHDPQNQQM